MKSNIGPALDKINPEFLKVVKYKITEIHVVVYNLLFRMTLAPEDRNIENMMSIFKTQSGETLKNYSPVSPTSIPMKLVKTVLKKIIVNIQTNTLYWKSQQYFWQGKSCLKTPNSFMSTVMSVMDIQLLLMKV